MNQTNQNTDEIMPPRHSGFYKFVALLTAIGLFLVSIQAYFYLIRPEPVDIPTLADIQMFLAEDLSEPFSSHQPEQIKEVINSIQDNTKQVANFIASKSCREADRVCQSKALFYFVRDEVDYVPDDRFHDQLENPLTVLKTGGADCEDMSVLLIALEKAIGNEARLVFVPSHAYAQIQIPNYRGEKWINLEATCDDCQFGELPNAIAIQEKEYYEI